MSVPIAWDDELRGALSVAWTTRRHVHDEDLRTLEAIAGLAAVSCRNAEAFEHVQHVARTDALTGVLNHGAMQLRIREEIARARRDGHPLGAVILDLDDFKGVNDTQGHAAGDELLRKVARALQGELRPYDQVARYGGDEFVLLLPGSDEAVTAAVAERCRDAIGGKCSIGVAAWHDGLDADGCSSRPTARSCSPSAPARAASRWPTPRSSVSSRCCSHAPAPPPPSRRSRPRSRSATTTRRTTRRSSCGSPAASR